MKVMNNRARDHIVAGLLMGFAASAVLCGGCKEDQASEETISPKSHEAKPAETVSQPKLVPADDKDQPRFALLFPTSGKAGDWIKIEPVVGGTAELLEDLIGHNAQWLTGFHIESCAGATYRRIVDGELQTVKVVLITAATNDDAYGILTVSSPGVDKVRFGDVLCRSNSPNVLHAVKGNYYVRFQGSGKDIARLTKGMDLLAGKMTFDLVGRSTPPTAVQVLLSDVKQPQWVFFVRDLRSLSSPAARKLLTDVPIKDPASLNKLLKMPSTQTGMAIVSYKVPEWPSENVVWVAVYPSAEIARQAYVQYAKVIESATQADPLHRNTMLKPTRSNFLLGCWTAEAESLAHLLPKISARLP